MPSLNPERSFSNRSNFFGKGMNSSTPTPIRLSMG